MIDFDSVVQERTMQGKSEFVRLVHSSKQEKKKELIELKVVNVNLFRAELSCTLEIYIQ